MGTTSIAKLKASLSHYSRIVRAGEEVLVTNRGKAVAEIVPVSPGGSSLAAPSAGNGTGWSDPTQVW